ncbi:MAG: ABC transporter permease, partial [Chloroflexota bacterium]
MLSPRWRKVARDLWNNKSRTLLVIASIAIGVFAFGGLFFSRNLTLSDLSNQYEVIDAADVTFVLGPFDDELVRWFERYPLVNDVQPKTVHNVEMVLGDSGRCR